MLFICYNDLYAVLHLIFIYTLQLDVLEYLHRNEYVHADIKAANLLLGLKDTNQVYLVDYGLATRYSR